MTALPVQRPVAPQARTTHRSFCRICIAACGIEVDVEGGRAVLTGSVDDLDDEDNAIAVAEDVPGILEVVSRLHIRAVEATSADDR